MVLIQYSPRHKRICRIGRPTVSLKYSPKIQYFLAYRALLKHYRGQKILPISRCCPFLVLQLSSHSLKVLSNEEHWGVETGINLSILINCFVGKCLFPVINGHHRERSINVLSILRTFRNFWKIWGFWRRLKGVRMLKGQKNKFITEDSYNVDGK